MNLLSNFFKRIGRPVIVREWFIASSPGSNHYIISNNPADCPPDAKAIPLSGPPTIERIKVLARQGCTVEVHNAPQNF